MVNAVRAAESSLGTVDYSLTKEQLKSREFSRSLFVVEDIKIGEKFTHKNVRSIRPWHGLHPKYLNEIIGLQSKKAIKKGTPLDLSHFELD